jgi:4-deoxy-L-threo-5-hexosulose-uronate ketol-isomerase
MKTRYSVNPKDFVQYTTQRIRDDFLIQDLFNEGHIKMIYSHLERLIVGAACPIKPILLEPDESMKAEYFLQRREMGIVNIGGSGTITVDGVCHSIERLNGMYIGMGAREVVFSSCDINNPAKFYFNSTLAGREYPTTKIEVDNVTITHGGSQDESNSRRIYKMIHEDGIKSCSLVMGMSIFEEGNVWNTMPCHTHDRRMEVYFYFELPDDDVIFHFMGEPNETRHIVVKNEEAILCPSWSIHTGVGTKRYAYIWSMAGENMEFGDMDFITTKELK